MEGHRRKTCFACETAFEAIPPKHDRFLRAHTSGAARCACELEAGKPGLGRSPRGRLGDSTAVARIAPGPESPSPQNADVTPSLLHFAGFRGINGAPRERVPPIYSTSRAVPRCGVSCGKGDELTGRAAINARPKLRSPDPKTYERGLGIFSPGQHNTTAHGASL